MAASGSSLLAERPLLLLSLDGGGVRGLSAIMILKRIMKTINEDRSPGSELEPWQVFDLMGGTSTGGIIALMLGRLKMRLEDCENAYLALSERIFARKRSRLNFLGHAKDFLQADGRFDSSALEAATKEIIAQISSQDVLLKDPHGPCKVFVVAVRENNSEAALLRSYKNPRMSNFLYDECRVWEACRATSAATTFFEPIQIGKYGQKFVDGAVRYNNPIQLVAREAEHLWPGRDQLILSIGTGSAPGLPFKGKLKAIVDGLKAIATETERTADDFHHAHRDMIMNDLLFRFNVYHGLSHIGLEEYREISAIADATEVYLDHGETVKKLEVCIGRLQATVAEELPYTQERAPMSLPTRGTYEQATVQSTTVAKFFRTSRVSYINPRRVQYLCYLREPRSEQLHGVEIKRTDEPLADGVGLFGDIPYVYIDYGSTDFYHWSSDELMALHKAAEKATRNLGFPAYWIACSCMPVPEDIEEVAWDMCDIIRAAQRLVLVVWTHKPGRRAMTMEQRLKDWGHRTWSMQPLLLAPRGQPIDIYDLSDSAAAGPTLSLPRRSFIDATPSDCFPFVRRLIDHFEGTLTLGPLDLVRYLIQLLFSTTTIEYLPGDHSYVLMGFLPFRPKPDKTDTAFQALARVLLTNDVDSFLDRWSCMLPADQSSWIACLISPDVWGSQLREIQPIWRVSGIGYNDKLFIDGAMAAMIEWTDADMSLESPPPLHQRVPDDPGDGRLRFICVKGNMADSAFQSTVSNLPGPIDISSRASPPPPSLSYRYTLVDTYTMTATPFGAEYAPLVVLVCGVEGNMHRALLCSVDHETGILYRETVIKMESRVVERMHKVQRVELAPYSRSREPTALYTRR